MYINQATIFGNITRDPELKALPSGQQVCSFSIATNKTYTDRDGRKQEKVEYHNIVAWGKTAENIAKYMRKGSSIYVQGELQTQSWDKDGVKHYRTEIVAYTVQFGPKKQGDGSAPARQEEPPARDETAMPDWPEEEINPEDIPF